MKVYIINQPEIEVTAQEAETIMQALTSGADFVTIRGEYITASSIAGIRKDSTGEALPVSLWGALPAGQMKNFFDDRREPKGDGYRKFQAMKRKMLAKKR